MRSKKHPFYLFMVIVALYSWINAQTSTTTQPAVPRLVNFSGKAVDLQGKPITGVSGATFAIYKDQTEGAPLWTETQNIHPDAKGNYTVQLGSEKSSGLPLDLFATGEARWLGVHIDGQEDQPRTLLLSVPYALKAMDAETLGGKPASAFLQAMQSAGGDGTPDRGQAAKLPPTVHGTGTTGALPLWTAKNTIANSALTQDSNGNINLNANVSAKDLFTTSVSTNGSIFATQLDVETPNSGDGIVATVGVALASGNAGITGGVYGATESNSGRGVWGRGLGSAATGVYGETFGLDPNANGVVGVSRGPGAAVAAVNTSSGDGLFVQATTGVAAFFLGDVEVDGNLSKAGGSFKIDHPLDPANKYLYHSFVESPDMKNIYDGTVTTNSEGVAIVTMPDWFEALNQDFRYQLTAMGQFAQAIVATKMANRQFTIKTDKPNVEVSWQVTGVRHDAWAEAHRIPVEQMKEGKERGLYLHPELFGAPAEKSIAAARHPNAAKMTKEAAISPISLGKR